MASASTSSESDLRPPEAKQPRTEVVSSSTTNPRSQDRDDQHTESEEEEEWEMMMEDLYIQEHYGTTADEIVDIVFNTSLQHLTALLPGMRKALMVASMPDKSSVEESAVASAKIDAGLAKYVESFYSTLERNSDALLLYLKRNIITIPENMVLPLNSAQIAYKDLVRSLQAKKQICGGADEPDYTEENTADLLANKAEKMKKKLLEKKLERSKLEHRVNRANCLLQRLNSLEKTLDSTLGEVPGSVREFILKSIAAAFELPIGNGAKITNGTK